MSRSKYKNLIIIGNGFDRWQGIPTSYEKFRLYYQEHVFDVAEELGYKIYHIKDNDGTEKKVTAVEIIYGNPFDLNNLESEFFWNLEDRLDKLDDQIINLYFGRSKKGIAGLKRAVGEATDLLRRLFCDWVSTFEIDEADSGFRFCDDCFVINFNYTDTVEKRFGIREDQVFHIHGSAKDPNSIVVGHSTHPEKPFAELIDRHFMKPAIPGSRLPRVDGLYAVEEALYRTDKHTADAIDRLSAALMKCQAHIEDFENIYVLGHSVAKVDSDYFEFINSVTRCGCDYNMIAPVGRLDVDLLALIASCDEEIAEDILMRMIILNIQYAMNHRNRIIPNAEDLFPELTRIDALFGGQEPYDKSDAEYAVKQRFWFEQSQRTQEALEKLASEYHVPVPKGCYSILSYMDYVDGGHDQRKRNATWHISYHSKKDEKRIKKEMKSLHIKQYHLYDSIDKCIECFKK